MGLIKSTINSSGYISVDFRLVNYIGDDTTNNDVFQVEKVVVSALFLRIVPIMANLWVRRAVFVHIFQIFVNNMLKIQQ